MGAGPTSDRLPKTLLCFIVTVVCNYLLDLVRLYPAQQLVEPAEVRSEVFGLEETEKRLYRIDSKDEGIAHVSSRSSEALEYGLSLEVAGLDISKLVSCLEVRSPHPRLPVGTCHLDSVHRRMLLERQQSVFDLVR